LYKFKKFCIADIFGVSRLRKAQNVRLELLFHPVPPQHGSTYIWTYTYVQKINRKTVKFETKTVATAITRL